MLPSLAPALLSRCNGPCSSQLLHAWGGRGCLGSAGSPSSGGGRGPPLHPASQSPGHCCQRWCDSLGTLPLSVPFSRLRADTQAFSRVRKRPGLRTLEMFLGTQLQGTCFHREENERRQPTITTPLREPALICTDPALDPADGVSQRLHTKLKRQRNKHKRAEASKPGSAPGRCTTKKKRMPPSSWHGGEAQ